MSRKSAMRKGLSTSRNGRQFSSWFELQPPEMNATDKWGFSAIRFFARVGPSIPGMTTSLMRTSMCPGYKRDIDRAWGPESAVSTDNPFRFNTCAIKVRTLGSSSTTRIVAMRP